ncbi:hypothetical protein AB1Y20_000984 [Prymnesium parvum]|uniref:Uncharacterized protein n=1 Tax=Prymnesium parvum TaxID=97485 RepID=A0AB34K9K7_PRYPA
MAACALQLRSPAQWRTHWKDYTGPLLSPQQLTRSLEHEGSPSALRCLRARLLRGGRRLVLAALGGSVTAGSVHANFGDVGSNPGSAHLYHQRVAAALAAPPCAQAQAFVALNGGVPDMGPAFFEHCAAAFLPAAPDLILLDSALNTQGHVAAFERLLRQLLRHPSAPAVVVVNNHRWRFIRSDGVTSKCWKAIPHMTAQMETNSTQWKAQRYGDEPGLTDRTQYEEDESSIAEICRRLDVPLVSMRAAVLPEVRSGRLNLTTLAYDCKHLYHGGHGVLAQIILHLLLARELNSSVPTHDCPASREDQLEAQPRATFNACRACAHGVALQHYVHTLRGFSMYQGDGDNWGAGLQASAPQDSVSFRFCCEPIQMPSLMLGFLRGSMPASVTCEGSCSCRRRVLRTSVQPIILDKDRYNRRLKYPSPDFEVVPLKFDGTRTAGACCHVRITVLNATAGWAIESPRVPLDKATTVFAVRALILGPGPDLASLAVSRVHGLRLANQIAHQYNARLASKHLEPDSGRPWYT